VGWRPLDAVTFFRAEGLVALPGIEPGFSD
jgi:hypothetical protein